MGPSASQQSKQEPYQPYQPYQPSPADAKDDNENGSKERSRSNDAENNSTTTNNNNHYDGFLPHFASITHHSGPSVAAWFKAFFQIVIGLSSLGASITFNYILSDAKDPGFYLAKTSIPTLLGICWLLFLLALAFASLASTVLNFFQRQAIRDWDGDDRRRKRVINFYATLTSLLLYGLVIAAFVVMSLVVAAYTPVVGWVAIGFTAVFGIGGFLCIIVQSPLLSS